MKLNFQQDDDTQIGARKGKKSRRAALGRAGMQLGQALGGVLSQSISALQSWRSQPLLGSAPPAPETGVHSHRLREVIERDRALMESQPKSEAPAVAAELADAKSQPAPGTPSSSLPPEGNAAGEAELRQAPSGAQADNEPVDAEFEEVTTPHALGPRADAIAQAIADAISESGEEELATAQPIQLEPLVAASSVTVVTPKKAAKKAEGCKEPIRTRTMAKLLASQGHRERALSIYDHLLRNDASDESLLAEADALRSLDT